VTLDGPIVPLIVLAVGGGLAAWRLTRRPSQFSGVQSVGAILLVVLVALSLERAMGRATVYRNGPVRLWSSDIYSDQTSQQIADPYTFTHVIHGAAFYGLTRLLPAGAGGLGLGPTLLVVASLEAAWEAYENTEQVINRYRAETISLGYHGDTLINSASDILACLGGVLLAWRRRAGQTLTWVIATELVLAFWIRDNLTLNILMLIYPLPAIRVWQGGA
jgi:hypothetical protein